MQFVKNNFFDFENYLQDVKNCPQIFWILLIYTWTCHVVDDQYCIYQIVINIERLGFTYEESRFIMAVKSWINVLTSMGIGYLMDKYQNISKQLITGSLLGVIHCVSQFLLPMNPGLLIYIPILCRSISFSIVYIAVNNMIDIMIYDENLAGIAHGLQNYMQYLSVFVASEICKWVTLENDYWAYGDFIVITALLSINGSFIAWVIWWFQKRFYGGLLDRGIHVKDS